MDQRPMTMNKEQNINAEVIASTDWLGRLMEYRKRLFAEIAKQLALDGHCKSYEGRIELYWPCYFGGKHVLHLACYVLGPTRGYDYEGDSWDECIAKANDDLNRWIQEIAKATNSSKDL